MTEPIRPQIARAMDIMPLGIVLTDGFHQLRPTNQFEEDLIDAAGTEFAVYIPKKGE